MSGQRPHSRFHELLGNVASEHDRQVEQLSHDIIQLKMDLKIARTGTSQDPPGGSCWQMVDPATSSVPSIQDSFGQHSSGDGLHSSGDNGLRSLQLSSGSGGENGLRCINSTCIGEHGPELSSEPCEETEQKCPNPPRKTRLSVTWSSDGGHLLEDSLENLREENEKQFRRDPRARSSKTLTSAESSHSLADRDFSISESAISLPGVCSNTMSARSSTCISPPLVFDRNSLDTEPPSSTTSMHSIMNKSPSVASSRRKASFMTAIKASLNNLPETPQNEDKRGLQESSAEDSKVIPSLSWRQPLRKISTAFLGKDTFKSVETSKTCKMETVKSDTPTELAPINELRLNPVWLMDPAIRSETNTLAGSETSRSYMNHASTRTKILMSTKRRTSRLGRSLEYVQGKWECSRLIASPSSMKRQSWEMLGFIFLLYDLVMVPMQIFSPEDSKGLEILQWCTTIFWSADIVASFLVGYHRNGFVEYHFTKIAIRYLKSWFILDFAIIALDLIFTILSRTGSSVSSLSKFSRGLRALRLLRIMKFHMLLSEMIQRVHSEYKRTMIGILKIVLFIILVNHFIACGFYGLSILRRDAGDKNWISANFDDSDGVMYKYWTSLHWSLTQFTPASMEVVPRNSLERFYTVVVMFVALITFSSFISSITNAMTRLRNMNESQMHHEVILHRYLEEHNISRKVVHRVLNLIAERKAIIGHRVLTKEEDVELFRTLPESLKSEVRYEAYQPLLTVHPFFFEYHVCDPGSVKGICRTALHERSLIVREELYGTGSAVQHMVFVRDGQLMFHPPEGAVLKADNIFPKGAWICEFALWASAPETSGPFIASLATDLVLLSAAAFTHRVARYPYSKRMVASYARSFMDYVSELAVDFRWDVMLCHPRDILQFFAHEAFGTHWQQAENDGSGSTDLRPRSGSLKNMLGDMKNEFFRSFNSGGSRESFNAGKAETQETTNTASTTSTRGRMKRSLMRKQSSKEFSGVVAPDA